MESSVCADVLTGIGVGGGMKIDSDIPTIVLWFVWIFPLLWHLTLDLDLECHLDTIDSFQCEGRPDLFYACMRLQNTDILFAGLPEDVSDDDFYLSKDPEGESCDYAYVYVCV